MRRAVRLNAAHSPNQANAGINVEEPAYGGNTPGIIMV